MTGLAINSVYCADCVESLKSLGGKSVALAVSDPPYNIGQAYDKHQDNMRPADYFSWCGEWLSGLYRVLQVNGAAWVFINDDNVSEMDVLAKKIGFVKRSHVIWYYTFGVNCQKKLSRTHTHLLYYTLVKDVNGPAFNKEAVAVPSMRQLLYKDKRAAGGGKIPDDTWILNPRYIPEGFKPDGDTWSDSRVCGTFKEKQDTPNQLPEALLGRIIRLCSNPGDLVLDPFSGSGTTVCVAKKLGRQYLGFDVSKNYVDASLIRLASVSVGQPLVGEKQKD
jgi:DNA modification methylase